MSIRKLAAAALVAAGVAASGVASAQGSDGVVRVKSAYSMDETIARIKDDIARKGIMFFSAIDQQSLAAKAGIELPPSTLLVFGNPALGSQFITAKGDAGLDWPVRLLVQQDDQGNVWAIYTDFGYVAQRHHITSRDAQFAMANGVVQSITSTVRAN
ncbi:MAG: DUF302 domain-containing protein [Burkholderiales bacterium]